MAPKRTFDEDDHQGNDDRDLQVRAKRRHGDPQLAEAMNLLCRSCPNQRVGTSKGREMELWFVNRLPPIIYTLANLTAEDGGPLQIELRYAASQQRVVTEQFSNMKIRICVLDGDFGSDDGNEDWSAEEFNAQTMKPRKGKGPLLRGDTVVRLQNGVASIPIGIAFTDVSITTGNKMFRLGVQFMQSNSLIREGISEPFKVMDKRGAVYKKSKHPALNDKLWRLKHIGKGGPIHRQLSNNGIKTVKDLLRSNTTGSLQEKFGNINALDKIIAHAITYQEDDDERYIYHAKEPSTPLSIVFNCIYEIVEVFFNVQNCGRSVQSLNSKEKSLVERVKKEAYRNLKDLVPIETTHGIVKMFPDHDLSHLLATDPQDHPGTWGSASASIFDEGTMNALLENGWANDVSIAQEQGDLFPSFSINADQLEECLSFHNVAEAESSNPPFTALYIPTKGKSKTVWQKARNILKWIVQGKLRKTSFYLFNSDSTK
ncbi:Calmodulin-binding protein 60 G, partial [Mucuna pruriens]